MREMRRFGLTLVRPGLWRHRSGKLIVQTDWDGPRGGQRRAWELADEGRSGLEIDGLCGCATLKEQAQYLDEKDHGFEVRQRR